MAGNKKTALKNLEKAGNFKTNPERINRTGANKGARWRKNLLKNILTMPLGENEQEQFKKLKAQFPTYFKGDEEKNFQFFMELKQATLVFSSDPKVAQTAIEKIKDRIEGRPITRIAQTNTKGDDVPPQEKLKELKKKLKIGK